MTKQVNTLTGQLVELQRVVAQREPMPNIAQLADTASTTARAVSAANVALGRTLTPGDPTLIFEKLK